MKHTLLFKRLIDVLFYALCLGFLALLFIAPMGLSSIVEENITISQLDFLSWTIIGASLIAYCFLIVGIKNLKNTARLLVESRFFEPTVHTYLRQSGIYLILSSLLNYLTFLLIFVKQLILDSEIKVTFDNNLLLQIFMTITGLFFIIQSDILKLTSELKAENDLTI